MLKSKTMPEALAELRTLVGASERRDGPITKGDMARRLNVDASAYGRMENPEIRQTVTDAKIELLLAFAGTHTTMAELRKLRTATAPQFRRDKLAVRQGAANAAAGARGPSIPTPTPITPAPRVSSASSPRPMRGVSAVASSGSGPIIPQVPVPPPAVKRAPKSPAPALQRARVAAETALKVATKAVTPPATPPATPAVAPMKGSPYKDAPGALSAKPPAKTPTPRASTQPPVAPTSVTSSTASANARAAIPPAGKGQTTAPGPKAATAKAPKRVTTGAPKHGAAKVVMKTPTTPLEGKGPTPPSTTKAAVSAGPAVGSAASKTKAVQPLAQDVSRPKAGGATTSASTSVAGRAETQAVGGHPPLPADRAPALTVHTPSSPRPHPSAAALDVFEVPGDAGVTLSLRRNAMDLASRGDGGEEAARRYLQALTTIMGALRGMGLAIDSEPTRGAILSFAESAWRLSLARLDGSGGRERPYLVGGPTAGEIAQGEALLGAEAARRNAFTALMPVVDGLLNHGQNTGPRGTYARGMLVRLLTADARR
jgi:hypothetical protein